MKHAETAYTCTVIMLLNSTYADSTAERLN